MTEDETKLNYQDEIQYLPISKIEANKHNPRQRFSEEEEDELIASILEKGILNPLIVFKKSGSDEYVILDGERRFRASNKLNLKELPARILLDEPDKLESLSLMFHIHHVQKDWTQFSISITLIDIIKEMGMNPKRLSKNDRAQLIKKTSLSNYKINRYLIFQDYPQEVIDRFLRSEIEEEQEPGADPDILLEMYRPIRQITKLMPELLKKYPVEKIIDSCIKKKANDVIINNKEFRFLNKSLTAADKGMVNKERLKEEIIKFIKNVNTTPESIYLKTAETYFQVQSLAKMTETLTEEINNLNLANISSLERTKITNRLDKLQVLIKSRFDI
ncbi:ParB/RepB/Spo0J family partition protein [Maribacter sp. HTCC2170]|uniref:ParB/RepB/Spo0J family partition protein n=1 Tax=Maribacter sp. (strain HTCC2170 / KCCM 42371) TaxID=313603 RepID=UPI00006BD2B1|nr:ParB/RepB/Spo0J family partition protein [Maribacter sp. HTCC2170]EAR03033.1 putative ParB-like chromosome partitioning protein [Maribacter sp. HTCC2170]